MNATSIAAEARLSSSLGRRDEAPNIELAEEVTARCDHVAVAELVALLTSGSRAAKNDAIKVLYEIGERNPSLIAEHMDVFLVQMHSRNNRMVWGALTALRCICQVEPGQIFAKLDDVLSAADKGSVIAKDQAIIILIALAPDEQRTNAVVPVLLRRLQSSAVNQLPMYAERIARILPEVYKSAFRQILEKRLDDDMAISKRRRINIILKRL